jgi:CubicO group peptidase (beta-lactamase class C family)
MLGFCHRSCLPTMPIAHRRLVLWFCVAWLALPVHAQSEPALADLDAFVAAELQRFNTPGVSVAVVKDGKPLLVKGYGFRDVERQLLMSADTVQPIASISKSFTVAALATLVRDGKLAWDEPVRNYLPDFRLHSDELTQRLTVRDLLTHRSGLPRHDAAWFGSPFSREQLYQRLRFFEPSAGLRERFQYNNFMFMTAGYLGGKLAGSSWEQLVQQNLFEPLGMSRSSTTLPGLLALEDRGQGYQQDEQQRPKPIAYQALDAMGPTGSINSSAADMARYLLMLTQGGQFDGKTVIQRADLQAMSTPQMVLPYSGKYPELAPAQYGMGFFVGSYRGQRYFEHGGDMPGSASALYVFPDHKLGIFVSVNLTGADLRRVLPYAIADRLLGLPPVDWSTRLKTESDEGRAAERAAAQQKADPQVAGTRPAQPLSSYVGDYEHPGYGRLAITLSGDKERPLRLVYNGMNSTMAHFHYEVFKVPDNPLDLLEQSKLQFLSSFEGDVEAVQVKWEPAVGPIVFKRLPDARLKDPKVLARFVGSYAVAGNRFQVQLRADGVLVLQQPGQPARALQGLVGNRFAVVAPGGRQLVFRGPPDQPAREIAVLSPYGNFIAKRSD